TRTFEGLYHVLNGAISPLRGIGPEQLKIKGLLDRIGRGEAQEIILATNPTVEGEATAAYLSRLIKPLGLKVTRLAMGLPVGGERGARLAQGSRTSDCRRVHGTARDPQRLERCGQCSAQRRGNRQDPGKPRCGGAIGGGSRRESRGARRNPHAGRDAHYCLLC